MSSRPAMSPAMLVPGHFGLPLDLEPGFKPYPLFAPRCLGAGREKPVDDRKLLGVGLVGAVVAALSCVTPVLVVLLTTVGLSALVGWLDYVLLPALAIFAALAVYALLRQRRANSQSGGLRDHG